jgi:hypothetical protein
LTQESTNESKIEKTGNQKFYLFEAEEDLISSEEESTPYKKI